MASTTGFAPLIEKYIDVILRSGVNIQPGQPLLVQLPLSPEAERFAHRLAERAYALGAGNVIVTWQDQYLTRLRVLHGNDVALGHEPHGLAAEIASYLDQGAARLSIVAPDPTALAGVDPERLGKMQAASMNAYRPIEQRTMSGTVPWSVVAIPTPAWAEQVFPDMSADAGMAELWRIIFAVARVDQPDPMAAWKAHMDELALREEYLNCMHFTRLHYRAPGTDLHVTLPETHLWVSGGGHTPNGVEFHPNIPTEEVFTAPQRDGTNGTVTSTLPLQVAGHTIEHLTLTLRDGRIVDYGAEKGAEVLKTIIERDEGSHYLGEIALVPVTSPCNTGFPFYTTLFDENAVSHIAIGQAYPICIEGGTALSEEQLAARGLNSSMVHTDFMVGSEQLDIDGETDTGQMVPVMRRGLWATGAR